MRIIAFFLIALALLVGSFAASIVLSRSNHMGSIVARDGAYLVRTIESHVPDRALVAQRVVSDAKLGYQLLWEAVLCLAAASAAILVAGLLLLRAHLLLVRSRGGEPRAA